MPKGKPKDLSSLPRCEVCGKECGNAGSCVMHYRRHHLRIGCLDIPRERFVELYNDMGLSISEVGRTLGISHGTAQNFIKRYSLNRSVSEGVQRAIGRGKTIGSSPEQIERKRQERWAKHGRPNTYEVIKLKADHPRKPASGVIGKHILIWEEANGRPLPDGHVIHHLNGIKYDNRPENLEAMPKAHHHFNLLNQSLQHRIRVLEEKLQLLEA